MPIPEITPKDLDRIRTMLRTHGAPFRIFADDIVHLVALRDSSDLQLLEHLQMLLRKLEVFTTLEEAQIFGDVTSQPSTAKPKPKRAVRGDAHVVPSKREQRRRQSGGGHTAHPIFGQDDFRVTGGESIDDDDADFFNGFLP